MIELSVIAIMISAPLLFYSIFWISKHRDLMRRWLKYTITGEYEPPKKQKKEE